MLLEVTQRAREAETTKNEVLQAKDRAQRLVDVIASDKGVAEVKLEAARPALEEAESALNTIKPAHIGTGLLDRSFLRSFQDVFNSFFFFLPCSYGAQVGTPSSADHEDHGLCLDSLPAQTAAHYLRSCHCQSQTVLERVAQSRIFLLRTLY